MIQLQRDLIDFSSQVSDYIDLSYENEKAQEIEFPITEEAVEKKLIAQRIKLKGSRLILHLSALAPLAPLISGEQLSSSLFGLEQLLIEVFLLFFKKYFLRQLTVFLKRNNKTVCVGPINWRQEISYKTATYDRPGEN